MPQSSIEHQRRVWLRLASTNSQPQPSPAQARTSATSGAVSRSAADRAEYRPLIDVKFNKTGLMASEDAQRKLLKLDEVEKKPNGLEESTKIYKREVGDQGPLPCASPAIVDGRLIMRLRDRVACYDLRAGSVPAAVAPPASSGE